MKNKKFIQHAIKKPGRVRTYILRMFGKKAFTKRGTIKVEYLNKAEKAAEKSGNLRLEHAILLAKRLKKFNKVK